MPNRVPFVRVLFTFTGAGCMAALMLGVLELVGGSPGLGKVLILMAWIGAGLRHALAQASGEE